MGKPQHHWRAVARARRKEVVLLVSALEEIVARDPLGRQPVDIAFATLEEYRRGLALPPQVAPAPSTDESATETAAEPEPPQGAA